MVAVLFQSNQKPEVRDTRDLWEIRTELKTEQVRQSNLYRQIRELENMIFQYESEPNTEKVETLKESVEILKEKAGLTEKKGKGVVITLKPIFRDLKLEQTYPTVPSDLMSRLFNELNIYGATDIAVEKERIISVTPVRSVGGHTYINNRPVPPLPIDIYVLAKDAGKLIDYMEVSVINDYFAIENIELTFSEQNEITLPAYDQSIDFSVLNTETKELGEQ